MSAVIRIKAELALKAAHEKLLIQHDDSRQTTQHAATVTAVRKEIDKLVEILADDASKKHFDVAARVMTCANYLALISNPRVQDARALMVASHRVLHDA